MPLSMTSVRSQAVPGLKPVLWIFGLTALFGVIGPPVYWVSGFAWLIRAAFILAVLFCGYKWSQAESRLSNRLKAVASVVAFCVILNLAGVSLLRMIGIRTAAEDGDRFIAPLLSGLSSGFPVLVISALLVAGVVLLLKLASDRAVRRDAIERTGYAAPVEWAHWRQIGTSGSYSRARTKLATLDLLEERSKMPRFIVWYRPAELDETKGLPEGQWVSAIDGNESVPGSFPLPAYIQFYIRLPDAPTRSRPALKLFSVDPDVTANLNRGPLRKERVNATAISSGKQYILLLVMGAEGAPLPQAPRLPDSRTTHGSGREETGDADAESR